MRDIGSIIKNARLEKDISIKQLASKVGCSDRLIRYYESKERVPSVYMANDILTALGISLTIGVCTYEE